VIVIQPSKHDDDDGCQCKNVDTIYIPVHQYVVSKGLMMDGSIDDNYFFTLMNNSEVRTVDFLLVRTIDSACNNTRM
jgi:hypothetical protein